LDTASRGDTPWVKREMGSRNATFGARIPIMRQAVTDVIMREGAGLAQLEIESARPGQMAVKAHNAVLSTRKHMQALQDVLALLEFVETGGSFS
jgi:hypothetical protein